MWSQVSGSVGQRSVQLVGLVVGEGGPPGAGASGDH